MLYSLYKLWLNLNTFTKKHKKVKKMNLHTQLKDLMEQEMDRKKFLSFSGGVILSVIGVTGFIAHLTRQNVKLQTSQSQEQSSGYGASYYGN